jgi:nucleoside-diphosphate-sugar epimerase
MVESALIIQNKGGGHGEIGYHLALELAKEKGMAVTILHEGPNRADLPRLPHKLGGNFEPKIPIGSRPHVAYGDLTEAGVDIKWFPDLQAPEAIAAVADKHFDAVVDNWSKDPKHIRPYAELAKKWGVETFAYVSSAGMYTPPEGDFSAITEDTPVKSTGQRQAEELLAEMDLPYTIFRPQYIYGPQENKCYCRFFFDRMISSTRVPITGDGEQKVTFTQSADAPANISLAHGNPAAKKEIFNCATSSLVTYSELAALCFNAVPLKETRELNYQEQPGDVVHGRFIYDVSVLTMYHDQYDEEVKEQVQTQNKAFPFRETPFFRVSGQSVREIGFCTEASVRRGRGRMVFR